MSIHYSLKNGIRCTCFSNWGYKNCLCFLLFALLQNLMLMLYYLGAIYTDL
jgi:hypothetical protein